MKKLGLGILIGILVLTLSGVIVIAKAITPQEKGKANAPDLEKIEFIHYKKNFAKPVGKPSNQPSCYKFFPAKVKWQVPPPVEYVINPTNSSGLRENFICEATSVSTETWDKPTSKELFKDYTNANCPLDNKANYGVLDKKNAVTFGNYPDSNVIAVTTVWYNPALKTIVEFDVMFDTDWTWGDADPNDDGVVNYPNLMDLQNIATHELGHGIGLNDVYETNCSAVTMYGYSTEGETDKRTLETPDIKGLQTLYP